MASNTSTIRSALYILGAVLVICTNAFTCHSFPAADEEEWSMVQKKGKQLMVNDRPFYVNGFNTYWLMTLGVEESTRGKVSDVLKLGSSMGLSVCRTWGFSDGGWMALQKSPSVYDEKVFMGLDFVLSEAKRYKIRLILTLANNWSSFGGKGEYVNWGKAAGLNLTSKDDFFSHPVVRGYYKDHVKTVLERVNTVTNVTYKDDPTIFAWELMNEPQCPSDPSGDNLQAWIQEMASYVKMIDPLHLVDIGVEGFYGPSTPERLRFNPNPATGQLGTDFIRNHGAFGVDFASVHIYPDSWLPKNANSESYLKFVSTWMHSHIDDAETKLDMPVIFGELGVSTRNRGYSPSFRDSFISSVYSTLLNSTRRGGSGGGSLLWQMFPEGTGYMDDGYSVVPTKSPTTMNLMALQSRRLQAFNSRCSWKCRWRCSSSQNQYELSKLCKL